MTATAHLSHRAIFAAQAAHNVATCSITNGVASPAVAISSPAYTIKRDTTVATASRTMIRTVPISIPAPSVINAIVSDALARACSV